MGAAKITMAKSLNVSGNLRLDAENFMLTQ
jgi:hypothetical protein